MLRNMNYVNSFLPRKVSGGYRSETKIPMAMDMVPCASLSSKMWHMLLEPLLNCMGDSFLVRVPVTIIRVALD